MASKIHQTFEMGLMTSSCVFYSNTIRELWYVKSSPASLLCSQEMDMETTATRPVCLSLQVEWTRTCRQSLPHPWTWAWTTANLTYVCSFPLAPRTTCPPLWVTYPYASFLASFLLSPPSSLLYIFPPTGDFWVCLLLFIFLSCPLCCFHLIISDLGW